MQNMQQKKKCSKSADPVFLSVCRVGDQMSDLGAEIFPDGSTHMMYQINQVFLCGKNKNNFKTFCMTRVFLQSSCIVRQYMGRIYFVKDIIFTLCWVRVWALFQCY